MQDAQVIYSHVHVGCTGEGHTCPSFYFGAKYRPAFTPQRSVVILSKSVQAPANASTPPRTHQHFARLTLDGTGNVVKLSVSR
jgi:hypothetical protein